MIVVLPLFFATKAEKNTFLQKCLGKEIPYSSLFPMQALPGSQLFVVTPSLEAAAVFAQAGVEAVTVGNSPPDTSPGLPPGTRTALRALIRKKRLDPDDIVVAADWFGAQSGIDALAQAWNESVEERGAFVASMQEVRDHPVQCHVPYLLLGLEMLVFPETPEFGASLLSRLDMDAARFGISRPFFFDWREYDVWSEKPSLYALDAFPDSSCPRMRPASGGEAGTHPLFLWHGPFQARRVTLFPPAEADTNYLVPAYGGLATVRASFDPEGSPNAGVSFCVTGLPGDASVRLWPFVGNRLGAGMEFPVESSGPDWLSCPLPGPVDGVIAAVVAAARESEYDFAETLIGGETLWTVDPVTKLRLDPATGKPFANRQEFPRLYRLTGAVAAGRAALLLDDSGIRTPRPFILPPNLGPKPCQDAPFTAPRALSPACAGARPAVEASCTTKLPRPEWKELFESLTALEALPPGVGMSAFRDIDRKIEQSYFKFQHLKEFVQVHTPPADRSLNLDTAVAFCADKIVGLRHELRGFALESVSPQQIPDTPRLFLPLHTPDGRSKPAIRRIALPGAQPPLPPRVLASDGMSRLFVSCYDQDLNSALFVKDLESGDLQRIGSEDSLYSGLWFDPAQDVVYAALYSEHKRPAGAIDVLDTRGRVLKRNPLTTRSGSRMFHPCIVSGDRQYICFMDAPSHSVLILDKSSLDTENAVLVPGLEYITDVKAANGVITMCLMGRHSLLRTSLQGDILECHSDPLTAFPRINAPHPDRQSVHVLLVDHPPVANELLRQTLAVHHGPLAPGRRFDLGQGRASDMHLLHGSGILALADVHEGLQLLTVPGEAEEDRIDNA